MRVQKEIVGIGTDIVEIERLRNARELKRAADFFFLPSELRDMKKSRNQAEFVASRLAAKEAVIKAYPGTIHYHDIAITKRGKKIIAKLVRPADKKFTVFVSIAHEKKYALGYAILCT